MLWQDILLIVNTALFVFLIFRKGDSVSSEMKDGFARVDENHERTERIVREDIAKNRQEMAQSLNQFGEMFTKQITTTMQSQEQRLDKLRDVVEVRLRELQADNSQKLEQMRAVVDEKLHATLEKRLGESFNLVTERLEKVHQAMGEMQTLASGVGDLKKVLTNVKTRGSWGEIQLGNLLEQLLTPEQYECNVKTKKGSNDPVEYAIKFSGRGNDDIVYLPIDSKFPVEDYERLLAAQDRTDVVGVAESQKAIETRIKQEAKKIKEKYIDPPHTTDFAIMFLPTEGLYAEVLRQPGLFEQVQREHRVTLAGPTTISAILNSFQMGFRTLAVEKRASEVWQLLASVKTEFHKFGDILDKTEKKILAAHDEIKRATGKTTTIKRQLDKVQGLSVEEPVMIEQDQEHDIA